MSDNNSIQEQIKSGHIRPIHLEHEMRTSFIAYAMSVITSRALPDVRDGLKPVHRRILHSMNELGVTPDKPTRKSARIVGDCMGKYHPHGDSSVYDAMVRLAQDFSTRCPLVEGQGNFGSMDGDGAAAMRYTEARLSKISLEMTRDIDKDTVDFVDNFDGTQKEPVVLPARFPNLLVNGSNGIAVGMATNIPPHNLGETIDGLCAMIDDPDISSEDLMRFIPGPDFPTGGIIMGRMGIADAYRTGRGRIIVRAKTEIEQMSANKSRIIVTEIPYAVNKARLVESIADLVRDKRIEGISDLRDETDRNGIRIVIELKKDVNAQVVLNLLYKHTSLQETFGAIMLALVDGEPKILTLRDMLRLYFDHQKDVVTRRTRYDLNRALQRLDIIEGLIIALGNIDEVVQIVKTSASAAEAKQRLGERFGLNEQQGQAILDMRLQKLVGLEQEKLREERDMLRQKVEEYRAILADEHKLMALIKAEALEVKEKYNDARRTEITQALDDIDLDDVIQEEDMVVTMTHFGYVKRISPDVYRAQNRGGRGVNGHAMKEEDFVERMFVTSTHSDIYFYTNKGRVYRTRCYAIPETGRTSKGVPVVNLVQLQEGEKVTAMLPAVRGEAAEKYRYLVTATRDGYMKRTDLEEITNIRKTGLIVQTIREGDDLIAVELSTGEDEFMVGTREGKCIRFPETEVRITGRGSMGVRAINLAEGNEVKGLVKVEPGATVLAVSENGLGKRTDEDQYRSQGRGGKGVMIMAVTEKTGSLACLLSVNDDMDAMLVRDDGTVIRTPVSQIPVLGRTTQGVRLMRVEDGTRISCVALAPHQDEEPEEAGTGEEGNAPAEPSPEA